MLRVIDATRRRFEGLYAAHRRDLLAYALRRATPQEAQDALSEAFPLDTGQPAAGQTSPG